MDRLMTCFNFVGIHIRPIVCSLFVLWLHAADGSPLPAAANSLWIELEGNSYQVGQVVQERRLKYLIRDRSGKLAKLSEQTKKHLAVLYEMASMNYLSPDSLEDLRRLDRSVRIVKNMHHTITVLIRVQEELVDLGIVGTAAFFTGGTVVVKKLGNVILDQLVDAVVAAPETVAKGWILAVMAESGGRLTRLIDAVERRRRGGLGQSASTPLPAAYIRAAYTDAVYIDVYAMPTARLMREIQPKADVKSQVTRILTSATEDAAEVILPPGKKRAIEAMIKSGKFLSGLAIGVPAIEPYRREVKGRLAHWQQSAGGLGRFIDGAVTYRTAEFYRQTNTKRERYRITAPNQQLTSEMMRLKGGCFQMGSPKGERGRYPDERQHRVCVKDFAIGRTEVTVGQWRRFIQATGYRTDAERGVGEDGREGCWSLNDGELNWGDSLYWKKVGFEQRDDYPVACVSWNDAQKYIEWLNRETGERYRLPTEAEWEYAARAGTTTARYWGEGVDGRACRYANVADKKHRWKKNFPCDDGYEWAAPVGSKQPNPWGLHDMLGNVSEWTCSKYDKRYGGAGLRCIGNKQVNDERSIRGGSWSGWPRWARAAHRSGGWSASRYSDVGFRLAQDMSILSGQPQYSVSASHDIYRQAFDSDPGFVSLAPDYAYWDRGQGNYYVRTRDDLKHKYWAYVRLPQTVDPKAEDVEIAFDYMVEKQNWGTYPGVRFYSSEPRKIRNKRDTVFWVTNGNADNARERIDFCAVTSSGCVWHTTPQWSLKNGVWYRVRIRTHDHGNKADLVVERKRDGQQIARFDDVRFPLRAFRYMGVGYYDRPDYGSDYAPMRIDNVVIRRLPSPE